ncbi:hypothetical protein L3Q82_004982 [Scortum barcoo]|uniref:Uncharacterized protein n=1 Tax=Scortum barcoo TaxID=214431 RepID=A0ACB8VDL3_9TELE|nr:hypothetical protein L3Q82_004982 [Scortum barcoo]
MAAESTRRFTKNLLKPGAAAEIRQTACNAVRHSAVTHHHFIFGRPRRSAPFQEEEPPVSRWSTAGSVSRHANECASLMGKVGHGTGVEPEPESKPVIGSDVAGLITSEGQAIKRAKNHEENEGGRLFTQLRHPAPYLNRHHVHSSIQTLTTAPREGRKGVVGVGGLNMLLPLPSDPRASLPSPCLQKPQMHKQSQLNSDLKALVCLGEK